jgi:beta-glucanase (GH16 family)
MTIKTALSLAALLTAISLAVYPALSAAHSGHNKTEASAPEGYQLVWADEFNTDGLPDREKWNYDTYRNKDGWWNEEEQYYSDSRPENARVEDGHLIIEARKDAEHLRGFPEYAEQLKGYADYGGQHYSSARLFTKGKASWHYGYFEIRAKMPCGRGLWPAIWTLPEEAGKWPDSGEIDIMEYVGHMPKTFHATIHTGDNNHVMKTEVGEKIRVKNACKTFHTHSLLWTEDAIEIALNGEPYFRYENDKTGEGTWPFNRPHHLLMNIAVGGIWGGMKGIDEKAFPARMMVDYVRVYQRG